MSVSYQQCHLRDLSKKPSGIYPRSVSILSWKEVTFISRALVELLIVSYYNSSHLLCSAGNLLRRVRVYLVSQIRHGNRRMARVGLWG